MHFFALEVVGMIVRAFGVLGFFFGFLRLGLRVGSRWLLVVGCWLLVSLLPLV